MNKVFISQPMSGKTKEEIMTDRQAAFEDVKKRFPNDEFELIDSYTDEEELSCKSPNIYYLGKAISYIADADCVYFADGWEFCKGCIVELSLCIEYNIPVINKDVVDKWIHDTTE